ADQRGDARLLHGDAVHRVRGFGRRSRVVRDDDELRARLELCEHAHEASNVCVVQRRVYLIEQTERARLGEKDSEHQRKRDERTLAARQQMDALCSLTARRGVDLDVAVERGVWVFEAKVALAAAEQRHENLPEVLAHLREGREKELSGGAINFADRLLERLVGGRQLRSL